MSAMVTAVGVIRGRGRGQTYTHKGLVLIVIEYVVVFSKLTLLHRHIPI